MITQDARDGPFSTVLGMAVDIIEFTDPGCPWAYSAEPHRLRIVWLYGDAITWRRRMVVLARRPEDYTDKGFTPDKLAAGVAQIAAAHGMPLELSQRPRMAATLPACLAVVAAREHAPELEAPLLRRLRLRNAANEPLDDDATIDGAATDIGLDPAQLHAWMEEEAVLQALESDAAAARDPMPAARILDARLAGWEGGRRYTCPTWEITVDGPTRGEFTSVIPGFNPIAVYETALANLLPTTARRDEPESVTEILEWAGEPLATQEVATIAVISRDAAAEQLAAAGATRTPLGSDALWSL
jgi:predicted DsbA family dithiol-disulfide isomerase